MVHGILLFVFRVASFSGYLVHYFIEAFHGPPNFQVTISQLLISEWEPLFKTGSIGLKLNVGIHISLSVILRQMILK